MDIDTFINSTKGKRNGNGIVRPYYFSTVEDFVNFLNIIDKSRVLAIIVDASYVYQIIIYATVSSGAIMCWGFMIDQDLERNDGRSPESLKYNLIANALPEYFINCDTYREQLICNYLNLKQVVELEISEVPDNRLNLKRYRITFKNPDETSEMEVKTLEMFSSDEEFDICLKLKIKQHAPTANIFIY